MSITCHISFENNPLKVCSPDQWILGNVRLTLQEEKKVRGVYVRILGRAYAKKKIATIEFEGEERLLSKQTYLIGSENDEVILTPGDHEYKFQCLLPADLPSSCEGKAGYVRFSVNVILDIPFWLNKVFEEKFTVVKAVNLNDDPANREAVVVENNHKFWPSCFSSGSVDICVRMPVSGYTPGQTINLDMNVNNKSNKQISEFSVKLIKEIKYCNLRDECCSFAIKRCDRLTINKTKVPGCGPSEQKTIRVNIIVPPVPPTDEVTSKMMKVGYFIQIKDSTRFTHMSPRIKIPFIIGTYPIQDVVSEQSQLNTDEINDSDSIDASSTELINFDLPDYEEEQKYGKKRNKKVGKKSKKQIFNPLYPVFKRQTSYSIEQ